MAAEPANRPPATNGSRRPDHWQSRFLVVPVDRVLVEQAIKLAGVHRLRGYDAVQLAALLRVGRRQARAGRPAPVLVSADAALNAAAAEGFTVDDPNLQP